MTTQLELNALTFAYKAHEGQVRKYTNEPYVTHPIAVAGLLKDAAMPPSVIAAGLLHDVLEDTTATREDILHIFGPEVTKLVVEVTDISKPEDGNRKKRKDIDMRHLMLASYEGQSIKCADLIHNTQSIARHDPKFAKLYLREKAQLLDAMREADADLWQLAWKNLEDAQCLLHSQK